MTADLTIILAQPRGFCAGVERAIQIVDNALAFYGPPIYVRHEIVHNQWVVADLRARGVIFVKELDEVPDGAITVMSAHGVAERVEGEAARRALPVLDATCPLVTKVHREAQRYAAEGRQVILIGHAGHPEVEGTSGRVPGGVLLVQSVADVSTLAVRDADQLAYVTQTTLSVDDTRAIIAALRARFPAITGPDTRDICYATQNRQDAVRTLAAQVDVLLVVGAQNSSNSNRLRDLAEECGIPAYLMDDASGIQEHWLRDCTRVGLSAGASAPEHLVQGVVNRLHALAAAQGRTAHVTTMQGLEETIRFKLPREASAYDAAFAARRTPASATATATATSATATATATATQA